MYANVEITGFCITNKIKDINEAINKTIKVILVHSFNFNIFIAKKRLNIPTRNNIIAPGSIWLLDISIKILILSEEKKLK